MASKKKQLKAGLNNKGSIWFVERKSPMAQGWHQANLDVAW